MAEQISRKKKIVQQIYFTTAKENILKASRHLMSTV